MYKLFVPQLRLNKCNRRSSDFFLSMIPLIKLNAFWPLLLRNYFHDCSRMLIINSQIVQPLSLADCSRILLFLLIFESRNQQHSTLNSCDHFDQLSQLIFHKSLTSTVDRRKNLSIILPRPN